MPVRSASSCGAPATPLERNDSGSISPRSTLDSQDVTRGVHRSNVVATEAPGSVPHITQSITIKRTRQEPSPTVQHSPTSRSAPTTSGNWSFSRIRQPAEPLVFDCPVGPKTSHFWGPLANWGFVIAGLVDMQKPVDMISPKMTSVMCVYSALFMRFAWRVQPRNYLLFSCHSANETVQLIQLSRWALSEPVAEKPAEPAPAVVEKAAE
ncbi:unnamed protein product [Closterium sp. Yama58-4]|nr:unnamed protein product [Closterium sp. Yama58-4]